MKVFATESNVNMSIHKGMKRSFHVDKNCDKLNSHNVKTAIMELDSDSDKQIISKMKACKWCWGNYPVLQEKALSEGVVKQEAKGSGFFMTTGTILQARDAGKARYKRHSKKDCWALNAKGSEVVELEHGKHDDLLSDDGRVRECLVCAGKFRVKVTGHIKPSSMKYQDKEVKEQDAPVTSTGFDCSVECIELILKLSAQGYNKDYIKGCIDTISNKNKF